MRFFGLYLSLYYKRVNCMALTFDNCITNSPTNLLICHQLCYKYDIYIIRNAFYRDSTGFCCTAIQAEMAKMLKMEVLILTGTSLYITALLHSFF